jgi:CTP synthase (UTP-ammonia lyase)
MLRIALIGDFDATIKAHAAIPASLALSAANLGLAAEASWLPTKSLADEASHQLQRFDGVWCVPGSPTSA